MRKKSFLKRFICTSLAVVSVASVTGAFVYNTNVQAETIEELQKKQQDLKKQQEDLQKQQQDLNKKQNELSDEEKNQNNKQNELNSEKNKTQAEVDELERELDKLLAELDEINKKADALVIDIGKANAELETQQQNSDIQYQDMKLRIQYMYENQTASIKESLVSSEDMSEFLNAADYYQKIYDYDRGKLDEIAQTIKRIEELTEKLNIELAEVEEVQKQMYAKENEINDLVTSKEADISQLNSRIATAAKAAAEAAEARKKAEEEEARLAAQEKKLVEEAEKAAAEEARIRAEEEARRKAAEEAARRAAEEAARKAAEEKAARERAAAVAAAAARTASANTSSSSSAASGGSSSDASSSQSSYTPSVTTNSTAGLAQTIATNARNNNGWYPAAAGMCAQWVAGIYAQSGAGRPYGNAIDYWNKWSYSGSTSKYDIPVGAAVISSGAGVLAATYGHIGIYLGNGMVASNIGGVKIESIDSFDRGATATCQGHRGYIGWVWPNGVALN